MTADELARRLDRLRADLEHTRADYEQIMVHLAGLSSTVTDQAKRRALELFAPLAGIRSGTRNLQYCPLPSSWRYWSTLTFATLSGDHRAGPADDTQCHLRYLPSRDYSDLVGL